jgi:tricorn protease
MRHVYLPVTGRGKVCLAWLLLCGIAVAADDRFALLHQPTVSKRQIAFVYADELWAVSRAGGEAVQLTNGRGPVDDPAFSPDGSWVAFTANFDGKHGCLRDPIRRR